jgi:hypothetical protein
MRGQSLKMDITAETQLLEAVLAKAPQLGLTATIEPRNVETADRRVDAYVRIGRDRKTRVYAVEVKKGLRPATLGAVLHQIEHTGKPPLLITDYVTPPLAEKLKARNIAFLDAAGNAYLDQPPVYVWIKGERPVDMPATNNVKGRAFQASGLKVLFALLCNPDWAAEPYREIARLAGVAHGTVGWVMADLPTLGFVADIGGERRLLRPELLLKQWAEAYARTLRPKLVLGRFRTDQEQWWRKVQPTRYDLAFGGEVAAERQTQVLRPETVTLYGERPDPRLLIDFKLQKDPNGPVEILKRFWEFPTENKNLTPDPLIYADLLNIGDARCLEAADLIYEQIVDGFKR